MVRWFKLQFINSTTRDKQMTNPYVLEEYLVTKSEKQVVNLIRTKVNQINNYLDLDAKYDLDYPHLPTSIRAKVKKAQKQAELAEYWIQAAMWSFTPELWDRMILDAGSCLECHGYEALTEC